MDLIAKVYTETYYNALGTVKKSVQNLVAKVIRRNK